MARSKESSQSSWLQSAARIPASQNGFYFLCTKAPCMYDLMNAAMVHGTSCIEPPFPRSDLPKFKVPTLGSP